MYMWEVTEQTNWMNDSPTDIITAVLQYMDGWDIEKLNFLCIYPTYQDWWNEHYYNVVLTSSKLKVSTNHPEPLDQR